MCAEKLAMYEPHNINIWEQAAPMNTMPRRLLECHSEEAAASHGTRPSTPHTNTPSGTSHCGCPDCTLLCEQ